jgi:hypothetical protein
VSLETALARIAELNSAFAPRAPAAPAPVQGDPSAFAAELQGAMAGSAPPAAGAPASAPRRANPGDYPHLRGDLDADPRVLRALETLAARRGETFNVTSGLRTHAEQTRLWNNRHSNPYPVARPGTSRHESGLAADVTIGGRAIQSVVSEAELRSVGLRPLRGDAVHVELIR